MLCSELLTEPRSTPGLFHTKTNLSFKLRIRLDCRDSAIFSTSMKLSSTRLRFRPELADSCGWGRRLAWLQLRRKIGRGPFPEPLQLARRLATSGEMQLSPGSIRAIPHRRHLVLVWCAQR